MVNPFLVKLLGYESEGELKKRKLNKKEYYEPGYERERKRVILLESQHGSVRMAPLFGLEKVRLQ